MDSSDSDMQEIDIENLLDEGLPDDLRERKKMHNYEERSKMVLEGNNFAIAVPYDDSTYLFLILKKISYRKRQKSL